MKNRCISKDDSLCSQFRTNCDVKYKAVPGTECFKLNSKPDDPIKCKYLTNACMHGEDTTGCDPILKGFCDACESAQENYKANRTALKNVYQHSMKTKDDKDVETSGIEAYKQLMENTLKNYSYTIPNEDNKIVYVPLRSNIPGDY